MEKRSKVRSRIVADQLVKLIKEADHVVIMGHRMSCLLYTSVHRRRMQRQSRPGRLGCRAALPF